MSDSTKPLDNAPETPTADSATTRSEPQAEPSVRASQPARQRPHWLLPGLVGALAGLVLFGAGFASGHILSEGPAHPPTETSIGEGGHPGLGGRGHVHGRMGCGDEKLSRDEPEATSPSPSTDNKDAKTSGFGVDEAGENVAQESA